MTPEQTSLQAEQTTEVFPLPGTQELRTFINSQEHNQDFLVAQIMAECDRFRGFDREALRAVINGEEQRLKSGGLTQEGFVNLNAATILMAEKTLKIIDQDTKTLAEAEQTVHKEQVEGILALEQMNLVEIPCDQGKSSFTVPVAIISRRLLTNEQCHLMTANPQLKKRDGERLASLGEEIGLRVDFTSGEAEEIVHLNQELRDLLLADFSLDWLQINEANKEQLKKKILPAIKTGQTVHYHLKEELEGHFHCQPVLAASAVKTEKPDIIVGDDRDFVFATLRNHHRPPWEKGETALFIDEELPCASASGYRMEAPKGADMQEYLHDWFLACITENICVGLEEKGLIELGEKGNWQFKEDEGGNGWEEWEKEMQQVLQNPLTALSEDQLKAIKGALLSNFRRVARKLNILGLEKAEIDVSGLLLRQAEEWRKTAGEEMVNAAALDKGREVEAFSYFDRWPQAWFLAKEIQRGESYVKTKGKLLLRQLETGHPLVGHKYTDLAPFILEARENICSFENPAMFKEDELGFAAFLEQAYGAGQVAITSGTLTYLAEELEPLLAAELIEIPRWGKQKELIIPEPKETEDRTQALEFLKQQIADLPKGQPLLLVCDNDEELLWLKDQFKGKKIAVVDTKTSVAKEKNIYSWAGKKGSWTFANPRLGRGIDIRQPAKWFIWGPLRNSVVLHQVLERKRVGEEPITWVVYQSGKEGWCGLEKSQAVRAGREVTIEDIHQYNEQQERLARLGQYFFDRVALQERGRFFERLKQLYGNQFTDRYLLNHFSKLVPWKETIYQVGEQVQNVFRQQGIIDAPSFWRAAGSFNKQMGREGEFLLSQIRSDAGEAEVKPIIIPLHPLAKRLQPIIGRFLMATRGKVDNNLTIVPTPEGNLLINGQWLNKEGGFQEGKFVLLKIGKPLRRKPGDKRTLENWQIEFVGLKRGEQSILIDDYWGFDFNIAQGLLSSDYGEEYQEMLALAGQILGVKINWPAVAKRIV